MLPMLLLACVHKDGPAGDEADDTSEDAGDVPRVMPFHGGCAEVRTATVWGEDTPYWAVSTLYDDEEREVEQTTDYEGEESVSRWTYDDAGCLTAFESSWHTFTQTCDDHANPVHLDGVYDGAAYTVDTAWTYDGDLATNVEYTSHNFETDETWTTGSAYTWVDGHLVREVESQDGVQTYQHTWMWEGDLLAAYVREDPDGFAVTWGYGYDAHDRLVEEALTMSGVDGYGRWTTTWFDAVHHAAKESETIDSPDQDAWSDTTWECSGAFPWTCTARSSGEDSMSIDGAFDLLLSEAWSCP